MGKGLIMEIIKNKIGEHKVLKSKGGITIKILKVPSDKYAKKMKRQKEKIKKQIKEDEKNNAREKVIQERIRKLAIKQLEEEGKI
jgi:hypothetical protein